MKKGLTELVFIIDKSGSMSGLETDTVGGYNSMLKKQQALEEECNMTTVMFNHGYELLHDRVNLKAVKELTENEYQVGGNTALLDALGRTIHKIINVQRHTAEDYRAEKVMFVIITDGYENASREYFSDQVRRMIEEQKSKHGWEFIFLGANIDAVETAGRYGISANRAVDYVHDGRGTLLKYDKMGDTLAKFRRDGAVDEADLEEIREDFRRRGGRR